MSQINVLEQQLRDLIIAPRRHKEISGGESLFSQLCSALDAIGDTEMALDAYVTISQQKLSVSELYLRTYGVLQALVIQQDAVEHIAESLSIVYRRAGGLWKMREIRVAAADHPTNHKSRGAQAFSQITRLTLSTTEFDLLTVRTSSESDYQKIDVATLIEKQRGLISTALAQIVEAEINRETDHRRSFRSEALAATILISLEYNLQKISEEIHGPQAPEFGITLLGGIRESLSTFEQMLRDRGELPALDEVFEYSAKSARNSLARLDQYLALEAAAPFNQEDADAFLFKLRHDLEELRDLAEEIDRAYASDPAAEPRSA